MSDFPISFYDKEAATKGQLVYHLKLKPGDVGRYVLMPGDPKRCTQIAKCFDKPELIADNREHATYSGYLNGVRVSVTSHGIGGPSTAIALEELVKVGADTFIRVGTSGGMQMNLPAGYLAIATGAIKADGTAHNYIPLEYPAVPDFDLFQILCESAKKLNYRFCTGVFHCKDAFYAQHHPEWMAVKEELITKWNAYIEVGAVCSEMESSTMFAVSQALNVRAAAIMLIAANQVRKAAGIDDEVVRDSSGSINVAIEALKILIDREKL